MLRNFSVSGIPFGKLRASRHIKIPQRFTVKVHHERFFGGIGSNKTTSIGAKRLKSYFFPEGREIHSPPLA
jgi:hypothetical protein